MPDGGIAWGTECRDQLEADLVGSVFTQFEIGEIEELRVRLEVRSGREERTLTAIITDLICNLYRQSQHQEGDASVEVTWDGCSYPVDPDVNQEQGGEDPRYIIEVLQRLGYIACGWPAGPDNQAIYCSLKVGSELTSLTESLATTANWALDIRGEEIPSASEDTEASQVGSQSEQAAEREEATDTGWTYRRPTYDNIQHFKWLSREFELSDTFDEFITPLAKAVQQHAGIALTSRRSYEQTVQALKVIIGNVYRAYLRDPNLFISTSRRSGGWDQDEYNPLNLGSRAIQRCLKFMLESQPILLEEKGGNLNRETYQSYTTRLRLAYPVDSHTH